MEQGVSSRLGAQIWGRQKDLWAGWGRAPLRDVPGGGGDCEGAGDSGRRDGQDFLASSLLPGSLLFPTDKLLFIPQSPLWRASRAGRVAGEPTSPPARCQHPPPHPPSHQQQLPLAGPRPQPPPDVHGEERAAAVKDGGQRRHERGHHHGDHQAPQTCGQRRCWPAASRRSPPALAPVRPSGPASGRWREKPREEAGGGQTRGLNAQSQSPPPAPLSVSGPRVCRARSRQRPPGLPVTEAQ